MISRGTMAISALLGMAALTAVGCGGDLASVTGTAQTADGAPLVGVRVMARSVAGKWFSGTTDEAGRYELGDVEAGPGVPPGDYQVSLVEDRGGMDSMRPPQFPTRYGNPDESRLWITVAAGESQVYDIKTTAN
jgi:hypothetical protein